MLPGGSGYFACIQNNKSVTTKFKSGGLHEKHVVATWNLGNQDCLEIYSYNRQYCRCLNNNNNNHPKADADRLYVPRKQGGRGLMQLEAAHAVEITNLAEYVDRKEDPLIQDVRTHQHNTDSAVLQAARCLKTEVQKGTRKVKDSIAEKTKKDGKARGCMDNCHVT